MSKDFSRNEMMELCKYIISNYNLKKSSIVKKFFTKYYDDIPWVDLLLGGLY